ncbi:MAG: 1,2-phenylacetyl-CoA epoxidase subunit PaaC [Armatimonadota bacterium]|nr:1,2-phenylacetyl-CoA epoxidase subunit PaaC [Armatimonadota bacterium]MDR7422591.1 1,2-phenylacetyl-CoA epoxidase subunit PaaC [Armatimonadota bacterium]MDR7453588.1 1,2-phenylacetyl-CoA epoxidase subunit PaaC [Armatimonadota bacterium]MDR7456932.1 1,2-phenylacetyl-CoA epoxidase subunit PaaC [Armatimonadota bacterium]MDR7496664.1 1,2-phenylacetyl-CoA epoxidase subunit PaaC [Armatimonadota bacterium]
MALWAAPDAPAVLGDEARREALRAMLLAWADDELILGHRHSEWTGFAPDIESDVALSSIAQDELGHARLLYEQAAGAGQTPDRLAFGRPPEAFRNATLVERENGDWAVTIVRAWLYDCADAVRLAVLAASPLGSFAALARTLEREEKYHRLFSDVWLDRLARAGDDSRGRVQDALDALWDEALALFEAPPGEEALVAAGALAAGAAEQAVRWVSAVEPRLGALGLRVPPGRGVRSGGRSGRHTPALAALLDEMTSVSRSDPEARW